MVSLMQQAKKIRKKKGSTSFRASETLPRGLLQNLNRLQHFSFPLFFGKQHEDFVRDLMQTLYSQFSFLLKAGPLDGEACSARP